MKYAALIFGDDERQPKAASRRLPSPEPGQLVRKIDGTAYRVASKFASPDGVVVRLSSLQGEPVQTPLDFRPVGLRTARLASWLRYHLAFNRDFDLYINSYIERYNAQHKDEPLPFPIGRDGKPFQWAKWFQSYLSPRINVPVGGEQAQDEKDEIIHEMLFVLLGHRDILSDFVRKSDSLGVTRQNAASKLTTFLISAFTFGAKEEAHRRVTDRHPRGELSIFQPVRGEEDSDEFNVLDVERPTGDTEFESADVRHDMAVFREGFGRWVEKKEGRAVAANFLLMFDLYWGTILQQDADLKRSDLQEEWKRRTNLGFSSFRDYYLRLPDMIKSYIRAEGAELGEGNILVDLMESIPAEREKYERREETRGLRKRQEKERLEQERLEAEKAQAQPAMASLNVAGVEEDFAEAKSEVVSPMKEAASKVALKLWRGDELDPDQRSQVLNSFPYRWTVDNKHRGQVYHCDKCDVRNDPYVNTQSAEGHQHPTIPLQRDDEWLAEHAFYFTNAGKLLPNRHAQPAYLAEQKQEPILGSVAHRFAMEKTRHQAMIPHEFDNADGQAIRNETYPDTAYVSGEADTTEFRERRAEDEEGEDSLSVARTILEQLGGNKFRAMTGAKNFVGGPNSLTFRLPGSGGFTKDGINAVQITLDPSDTYTVAFSRARGGDVKVVSMHRDVYAENLREVFERATGLYTSLGTMGRKRGYFEHNLGPSNSYWRVTQPFEVLKRTGSQPTNSWYGSSQIYEPTYEEITLPAGAIVENLHGGLFFRMNERDERHEFVLAKNEKHPFEKRYMPDQHKFPMDKLEKIGAKVAATGEVWECMDCENVGELSREGRCEVCDSEAVFPKKIEDKGPALPLLPAEPTPGATIRETKPVEVEKRMVPRRTPRPSPGARLGTDKTAQGSGNTTVTMQEQNVTTPNVPGKGQPIAVPDAIPQGPGPHSPNAPATAPRTPSIQPRVVNVPAGTEGDDALAINGAADEEETLCPRCHGEHVDIDSNPEGYKVWCDDCDGFTYEGPSLPGHSSHGHDAEDDDLGLSELERMSVIEGEINPVGEEPDFDAEYEAERLDQFDKGAAAMGAKECPGCGQVQKVDNGRFATHTLYNSGKWCSNSGQPARKAAAGSNSGEDDPRGAGDLWRENFYEHRTEGISPDGMVSGIKEGAGIRRVDSPAGDNTLNLVYEDLDGVWNSPDQAPEDEEVEMLGQYLAETDQATSVPSGVMLAEQWRANRWPMSGEEDQALLKSMGIRAAAPAVAPGASIHPNVQQQIDLAQGEEAQQQQGGPVIAITPNQEPEQPERERHTVEPELPNARYHMMGGDDEGMGGGEASIAVSDAVESAKRDLRYYEHLLKNPELSPKDRAAYERTVAIRQSQIREWAELGSRMGSEIEAEEDRLLREDPEYQAWLDELGPLAEGEVDIDPEAANPEKR